MSRVAMKTFVIFSRLNILGFWEIHICKLTAKNDFQSRHIKEIRIPCQVFHVYILFQEVPLPYPHSIGMRPNTRDPQQNTPSPSWGRHRVVSFRTLQNFFRSFFNKQTLGRLERYRENPKYTELLSSFVIYLVHVYMYMWKPEVHLDAIPQKL